MKIITKKNIFCICLFFAFFYFSFINSVKKASIKDNIKSNLSQNHLITNNTYFEDTLTIQLSTETGYIVDTLSNNFQVEDFNLIAFLQFSLAWNPLELRYSDIRNFNLPDLTNGSFNSTSINKGGLALGWFDNTPQGSNLVDGSFLFELNSVNNSTQNISSSLIFSDNLSFQEAPSSNNIINSINKEELINLLSNTQNCIESDSLTLVALYNSTNGDTWSPMKWDLTQPMSTWDSLTLNKNGCVTSIRLQNNNLSGRLPEKIGDLSQLEEIALWDNKNLTGQIPTTIKNLANLKYFSAFNCNLTGGIPTEIGNLTELNWLSLVGNTNLGGTIPTTLGNLTKLEGLYLSSCGLTGKIPDSLQNLTAIKEFSLASNLELTGTIPAWFSNFTQVERLLLFGNNFKGTIPSSLGDLTNLTHLYLHENSLSGCFPDNFSKFCSWTNQGDDIDNAGYNFRINAGLPWSGDLDNSFCNSSQNQIGAICNDLDDNTNDDKITVDCSCQGTSCQVVGGTIIGRPFTFCVGDGEVDNIPSNEISLSGNLGTNTQWVLTNINGDILSLPSSFSAIEFDEMGLGTSLIRHLSYEDGITGLAQGNNIADLVGCYNFSNSITITNENCIPTCRSLDSLVLVALYNATDGANWTNNANWLTTNPINEWYGIETNDEGCVTRLRLSSNNLINEIPSNLGNLANLEALSMELNQLTGNIPIELGNLKSLKWLILHDNQLTGNIPPELGNLNILEWLILYDNQLTGDISPELGRLNNLDLLMLHDNQLTGNIPPELGNLSKLFRLYLNSNQLTGSIPKEIGNLVNLTQLALSNNQLDGCYPDDLLKYCNLTPQEYTEEGFLTDDQGYNLSNNPGLPWQGNMEQWCNNEPQIGSPCDDGNPATDNDIITEDCECKGTSCQPQTITVEEQICQGNTYIFGNLNLSQSGTYENTFQTKNGCDSIVTLNLQVNEVIRTTLNQSICQGTSFSFNNQSLSETGDYQNTLQSTSGCDSIVTLNLQVNEVFRTTLNQSICQGTSFPFGNSVFTESGEYKATFKTTQDCDSIVTLSLIVNEEIKTTIEQTICQGQSYIFGIQTLTQNGEYEENFQTTAGCDSTVTLSLRIINTTSEQLPNINLCSGESYQFGNQELTQEGLYYDTLQSQNGCDSVIQELLLEIIESASLITKTDTFVFDNPKESVELAILENDNFSTSAVPTIAIVTQPASGNITVENIGAEQISFSLPETLPDSDFFTYQVCVEQEGCETACSIADVYLFFEQDCIDFALSNIPKAFSPSSSIPDNMVFHPLLAFEEADCVVQKELTQLTILNRWGEVIFKNDIYSPWNGKRKGGIPLPPNIYYYVFKYGKGKKDITKGAINLVKME